VRLPQLSADLVDELPTFLVKFFAQPLSERCHAAVEDVSDVEFGIGRLKLGRDRRNDPGPDNDLGAVCRATHGEDFKGRRRICADGDETSRDNASERVPNDITADCQDRRFALGLGGSIPSPDQG